MHTILSCSRIVVRAFVNGLYQYGAPLDSSDPPPGATPSGAVVRALATSAGVSTPSRFVAAKCGFPKDMVGGPSTVLDQDYYGDDACFVATHRSADVVGVADGVGGWRSYGIDPSNFSRSLMRSCADLVRSGEFRPHRPAQLIASAYDRMSRDASGEEQPLIGSSTACVVVLDKAKNELHTANLGDSGFLVLRKGRIVHRSQEQCHYFNAPFQLCLAPKEVRNFLSDSPESAETTSFMVEEGDVILVASDGLFDNLPAQLIEAELTNVDKMTEQILQAACNSLALQARRLAFDQKHMSPFAKKAREYGIKTMGGKPDDITVLLAVVTREAAESSANGVNQSMKDDDELLESQSIISKDMVRRQ